MGNFELSKESFEEKYVKELKEKLAAKDRELSVLVSKFNYLSNDFHKIREQLTEKDLRIKQLEDSIKFYTNNQL